LDDIADGKRDEKGKGGRRGRKTPSNTMVKDSQYTNAPLKLFEEETSSARKWRKPVPKAGSPVNGLSNWREITPTTKTTKTITGRRPPHPAKNTDASFDALFTKLKNALAMTILLTAR
jgi:hypothetical protein